MHTSPISESSSSSDKSSSLLSSLSSTFAPLLGSTTVTFCLAGAESFALALASGFPVIEVGNTLELARMVDSRDDYIIKSLLPLFAIVRGISSSDPAHNRISIKSSPTPLKLKYVFKQKIFTYHLHIIHHLPQCPTEM